MEPNPIDYSRRIVVRILDIVVGIIELLLGLRIMLRLLGANPGSEFVAWLYGITGQLVAPFYGMFPDISFASNYVIEFSTIFAMLVYAFLGWLVIRIISFVADTLLRLG